MLYITRKNEVKVNRNESNRIVYGIYMYFVGIKFHKLVY